MGLKITIVGVKSDDTATIRNTVDEYIKTSFLELEHPYKLITDLEDNKGWSVLLFELIIGRYEALLKRLSINLQTMVTGISVQDTTNYMLISTYKSGEQTDELETMDLQVLSSEGFFADKFADPDDIDSEEEAMAVNGYEDMIGLHHYSSEILDQYDF